MDALYDLLQDSPAGLAYADLHPCDDAPDRPRYAYQYATPDDTHRRTQHTPALDCYVIGCKFEPTLTTRHTGRQRTPAGFAIVQACTSHDPVRTGQGAPLYKGMPAAQALAGEATDAEAEQPAQSRDERIGEILRTLVRLASEPDDDQDDQDDTRGGTPVMRPTPPTRPTPPSQAVDPVNF